MNIIVARAVENWAEAITYSVACICAAMVTIVFMWLSYKSGGR